MPRRYSDDEKERILYQLVINDGNVSLTARETGVPERTLYLWKRQLHAKSSSLLQNAEVHFAHIYEHLMQHALTLAETLDPESPLLLQRVTALSRLIDRVIKIQPAARGRRPIRVFLRQVPARSRDGEETPIPYREDL